MATTTLVRELSPAQLLAACQRRLQLRWLGSAHTASRKIPAQQAWQSGYSLVNQYNPIHSRPVQILDQAALNYLGKLKKNSLHDALEQLCAPPTSMIIIAAGLEAPKALQQQCALGGVALLGSPLGSERLVAELGHYLGVELAESEVFHGVFMEVMGIGVLLTGDSGIGKSELALELINRGQRLVADDAPIFRRIDPDTLTGHCPPLLQDYLEVRGLGLLNIRAMFGDSAVKRDLPLALIVHLSSCHKDEAPGQLDRLHGSRQQRQMLGVTVSAVTLPVAPGRNLAILIEAAVRAHILYTNGDNPVEEFIRRQQQGIQRNTP